MRAKRRAPETPAVGVDCEKAAILVALDALSPNLRSEALSLIRYHAGDQTGDETDGIDLAATGAVFPPAMANRLSSACDVALRDMLLEELDVVGLSEDLKAGDGDTHLQAELEHIRQEALRRLRLIRTAYNYWSKRR